MTGFPQTDNNIFVIIGCSSAGLLLLIIVGALICFRRRRKHLKTARTEVKAKVMMTNNAQTHVKTSHNDLTMVHYRPAPQVDTVVSTSSHQTVVWLTTMIVPSGLRFAGLPTEPFKQCQKTWISIMQQAAADLVPVLWHSISFQIFPHVLQTGYRSPQLKYIWERTILLPMREMICVLWQRITSTFCFSAIFCLLVYTIITDGRIILWNTTRKGCSW